MNSSPYCANCRLHGWKQLEDTSQLKQCKNCKVVQYCGEDCQREHWKKVHKQQCQHFVNQDWGQKEADCQTCRQVAALGKSKLKRPSNPNYGCIFKEYNFPPSSCHPLPFPITGQPGDLREKATIVLWQLLHKFGMLHPMVVRDFRGQVDKVFASLKDIILSMWEDKKDFTHPELAFIPRDAPEGRSSTSVVGVLEALDTINEAVIRGRSVVDPFQLWNIIMLVRRLVVDVQLQWKVLKDPQAEMPDELKEIVSQGLETQVKFLPVADQIISALATKVIPFQEVLKIVCGGSLNQNCHFCQKEIIIAHANIGLGGPTVVFGISSMGIYGCDTGDCIDKTKRLAENDSKQITMAMESTFMERKEIRCDFCFQLPPMKDVHRCNGCLKVMYCSKTCQNHDWKIHKIFCKKDGEPRKVKLGGSGRRKAASEGVEALEKETLEGVVADDVAKEVMDKFKIKNAKKK